jgi:hypothetical protein
MVQSTADGIGAGFNASVLIRLIEGKAREVRP